MAEPAEDTIRILCFGDSLTSGYSNYGISSYPYADTLHELLGNEFPFLRIEIVVQGMPGDQVQGQFRNRIRRALEQSEQRPFDWIVVLGGTNDLGWGRNPDPIYENLKAVWSIALASGAKVLALTVIEAGGSSAGMDKKRNDLNEKILTHAEPRFYTLDLWKVIRYNGVSDEEQERIWNDGVHLTEAGYEAMGSCIATRLMELIHGE